MRVWIASVVVLFWTVELYQWFKPLTLPLPVFILSGAFLAVASNYGKCRGWFEQLSSSDAQAKDKETISGSNAVNSSPWASLTPSTATSLPKPGRSISFTIRRRIPEERHDS